MRELFLRIRMFSISTASENAMPKQWLVCGGAAAGLLVLLVGLRVFRAGASA